MQPAAQAAASPPPSAAESVREGVFQPLWINGLLLLVRRVSISGEDYAQGCWLDWDELRPWLLDSVGDLLPNASLEPADAATLVDGGERRLAGLPIRLVASPGRDMVTPRSPQIWMPLAAAWACVILAAVAVGMVLFGTVALSERRAAFVSAVTHELRTPLTTFRLYTEMLAGGMVRNAEKRQGYLATLHTEALRLGHLVENVLAYARLERNRAPICRERIGLPDFLARVADRFKERAEQAGMELVVEAAAIDRSDGPESASHALRVDAQALEQILFNLIDNACKYAQTSTDRRIHLRVNQVAQAIEFQVRDHGPGLGPAEHRRLFRPFHKSAREAADTAPGVGLGLALSRRLARAIGGKLRLTPCDDGACFTLTLRT
jgi:signal transduction histidine kinase